MLLDSVLFAGGGDMLLKEHITVGIDSRHMGMTQ